MPNMKIVLTMWNGRTMRTDRRRKNMGIEIYVESPLIIGTATEKLFDPVFLHRTPITIPILRNEPEK